LNSYCYFSGRSIAEYKIEKIPAINDAAPWNKNIPISPPPGYAFTTTKNPNQIGAKIIARIPPTTGLYHVINKIIKKGMVQRRPDTATYHPNYFIIIWKRSLFSIGLKLLEKRILTWKSRHRSIRANQTELNRG
jgi:hypothetical protein